MHQANSLRPNKPVVQQVTTIEAPHSQFLSPGVLVFLSTSQRPVVEFDSLTQVRTKLRNLQFYVNQLSHITHQARNITQ